MPIAVDLVIDLQCLAVLLHCFEVIPSVNLVQGDVAEWSQQVNAAIGLWSLFQFISHVEVLDCSLELFGFLADSAQYHVYICAFRPVLLIDYQQLKRLCVFLFGLLVILQSEVAVTQHRQHLSFLLNTLWKTSCTLPQHILEVVDGLFNPPVLPGILAHLIQHATFLSNGLSLTLGVLDLGEDVDQTAIVDILCLLTLLFIIFLLFGCVQLKTEILIAWPCYFSFGVIWFHCYTLLCVFHSILLSFAIGVLLEDL